MRTELIKRFCELAGIEWHEAKYDANNFIWNCSCGKWFSVCDEAEFLDHIKESNPTFLHPEEVLAVCMKWDDRCNFIQHLWYKDGWMDFHTGSHVLAAIHKSIPLTYITTPNKLLEAAVEWGGEK
jgi:hypothetical protein